jgi:hypothetical protein
MADSLFTEKTEIFIGLTPSHGIDKQAAHANVAVVRVLPIRRDERKKTSSVVTV